MSKVQVDRVVIRLRGISASDARRAAGALAPALNRALQARSAAQAGRVAPLADRIAGALAAKLRGGQR
ncbi:MAG: hypothetical protein ACTHU0_11265 [Kofleriaceae bacterium]